MIKTLAFTLKKKKFTFLSIALCPSLDPNQVPSAYKADVLTTVPWWICWKSLLNKSLYLISTRAPSAAAAAPAARAGGSHCLSQRKYAHPPHCFTASAVPADAEKQRGGCAYLR